MGASSNFGNMLSMAVASIALPFLPMLPTQILLNNLLYEFSQTAVASDEVDAEYLAKPRQWDLQAIKRFMLYIGPISSIFDYATFAVLWFVLGANGAEHQTLFQTGWFVESLLWMLLSGDHDSMEQQLCKVLEGYEQFRPFDRRELYLVEALRTLRLLHYSAWIAQRWDDPAFPAAFPWFNTQRYWQDRILELREQTALMDRTEERWWGKEWRSRWAPGR